MRAEGLSGCAEEITVGERCSRDVSKRLDVIRMHVIVCNDVVFYVTGLTLINIVRLQLGSETLRKPLQLKRSSANATKTHPSVCLQDMPHAYLICI
eukprot:9491568-Pyramimonas_sp.AAC.2